MSMRKIFISSAVLSLLMAQLAIPALSEPRGTHWLNVGDTIEVDKLQASTPAGAMWTTGTILEVNRSMNSYVVDVEGVKMTIINSDKWIKPAAGQNNQGGQAQQNAGNGQPGGGTAGGVAAGAAGGHFKVGDFVQVDKLMANSPGMAMWTAAKVVSVNKGMNSFDVLLPDGARLTIVNKPEWIKAVGAAFDQAQAAQQAPQQAAQVQQGAPAQQPPGQRTQAPAPKTQPPRAGVPEWEKRKGLGVPPDGTYVVNKVGYGYGLDVGNLIIRGNTYSGIVRGGGATAQYTMDGDHIVWTNGLEGLPPGSTLVSSKYIGADEHGRPLIRIFYRGTRGALETIDAYRVSQ